MTDIERRHDLPRCPFCGQWPADAGEFYVCCVTDGCPMSKAGCVEIEAWCQRPLEREYDADLAHARGDWTDPHCPRFTASQPLGMITRAVLGPDPMEEQP